LIYLLSFLLGVPSPLFLFLNAEAWTISSVLLSDAHPFGVAVCVAAGQLTGYTVCYFNGPWLLDRIPSLARRINALQVESYRNASYGALFVGAIVGFPPTLFFTFLRKRFNYRFVLYFGLVFVARLIRFSVLAFLPQTFAAYFVKK
jgi:membrane protein YqaA with SNARE-associated domain